MNKIISTLLDFLIALHLRKKTVKQVVRIDLVGLGGKEYIRVEITPRRSINTTINVSGDKFNTLPAPPQTLTLFLTLPKFVESPSSNPRMLIRRGKEAQERKKWT